MIQVSYDSCKTPMDYLMGGLVFAMLFFSYFGVSVAFCSIPWLGLISLEKICGIFAIIVVAAKLASGYKPKSQPESVYYLYTGFIILYGATSLLWSPNRSYSIRQFASITIAAILASALLMSVTDKNKKQVDGLVFIIFILNMAIGIFEMVTKHYLFQRANEYVPEYRTIAGFAPPLVGFYNTNDFCIAMVQLVPIIVFRFKNSIIRIVVIVAAIFVTAVARSDFALLAILSYLGVYLAWRMTRSRRGMAFFMLILAVMILPLTLGDFLGKTMIFQRVQKLATDVSFISRTALYEDALAISVDHFGGGLGTGNSERVVAEYSATHADTLGKVNLHSLFLQLLVEYGWAGLLLFLVLLWSIFKAARAIPRGADPDRKALLYGSLLMLPFTFSSSSNSITSAIAWITPALLILHLNMNDGTPWPKESA